MNNRGWIKILTPLAGDPWWGFISYCAGSCAIHTPRFCISIHYPRTWAARRWFPNLCRFSFSSKSEVAYKTKNVRYRYTPR